MILDTKVSYFNNTKDISVKGIKEIRFFLDNIENGEYKDLVQKVRSGDKSAKLKLPTIAFHGIFEGIRSKKSFIESSGLIIIDIDDIDEDDDIEEIKKDIFDSSDSILAVMISPSGNGIKLLYYVQQDIVTSNNYRQIGKQIADDYSIYGNVDYLSITDCLIATYDPNILINEDAWPDLIYIESIDDKKVDLEKLDESKELWDDAEDFFDTVLLEEIENKTNNNFHFIQISILDLAKFGFYHPETDLSFVIDYAEDLFKYSKDNKERFISVTNLAKNYPQQKWPYKYTSKDDDFEEPIDYSQYLDEQKVNKKSSNELKIDGFIEYSDLFKSVLERISEGDRVGREISLSNFADIFRFKGTGVLTVTGIPTHGKTEFIDQCIVDLARLYGEETIVAGFEQTVQEHLIKLMRKVVGTNITCPSYFKDKNNTKELEEAYNFIVNHISHIDITNTGGDIDTILKSCAEKIKKDKDIRYVVLDPFNMLSIKGGNSKLDKIEEILRRITMFSHQMKVMVILVAHPFKMKIDEKTNSYVVPDFYSVKGSSAFFEMSYHGLVVYRTGYNATDPVFVKVLKVKQNNLGVAGEMAYFSYNKASGRYIPVDLEGNELKGDHNDKDWLKKIK